MPSRAAQAANAIETRNVRIVRGPRVAGYVRERLQQRRTGPALRQAFERLESQRGVKVDIDAAWGVIGYAKPRTRSGAASSEKRLRLISTEQQWSISEDTVELIWVPGDSQENYWLGTFYATLYDESGQILADQISNIEQQYILPSAEGWDETWRDHVYAYDNERGPIEVSFGGPSFGGSSDPSIGFRTIQFRSPRMMIQPVARWLGRYKQWLGCSVAWCAGAAGGCALGNWWNAEIAWAPCTGVGCTTAFVGCTYGTLWEL